MAALMLAHGAPGLVQALLSFPPGATYQVLSRAGRRRWFAAGWELRRCRQEGRFPGAGYGFPAGRGCGGSEAVAAEAVAS